MCHRGLLRRRLQHHFFECADQIIIATVRLALMLLKRREDILGPVDGGEHQGDGFTGHRHAAVAELSHQSFGGVRQLLQPRQPEEAAGAFDGVNQPEDVVENLRVVGLLLKRTNSTLTVSRLSFVSVKNSRSRSSMKQPSPS